MTTRHDACGGCGAPGPSAESTRTMTEEGWRLTPIVGADGRKDYAWCCPKCWEERHGSAPLRGQRKKK